MVMVHARTLTSSAGLTEQLEAGVAAPRYHATSGMAVGARGDARASSAEMSACRSCSSMSPPRGDRADRWRRARPQDLRRACRSTSSSRRTISPSRFEGANACAAPPPRDKANSEVVWEALSKRRFQVVSSDHSPTRFNDAKGQDLRHADASFRHIPNGVPASDPAAAAVLGGDSEDGSSGQSSR